MEKELPFFDGTKVLWDTIRSKKRYPQIWEVLIVSFRTLMPTGPAEKAETRGHEKIYHNE